MSVLLSQRAGSPAPFGPAWTPLDLGADLIAWWSADRADLITHSGGAVSSWKDIVAGYDAVQATGAAKPTYGATGWNGAAPGITGDGVDDALLLAPVPGAFPTGSTGGEAWALADQAAAASDGVTRTIAAWGNASAGSRHLRRSVVSGVNCAEAIAGDGSVSAAATNLSVDFTGRHVVRVVTTPTSVRADVNGIAGSSVSTVPATLTNRFRLFANSTSGGGGYFQGTIRDVLLTSPLSGGNADLLLGYLTGRR